MIEQMIRVWCPATGHDTAHAWRREMRPEDVELSRQNPTARAILEVCPQHDNHPSVEGQPQREPHGPDAA